MNSPELSIDGQAATITLRRPELANRLSPEDLAVMADHVASVNARPEVLVLLIRGSGRYFCSGYDIASIGAVGKSSSATNETLERTPASGNFEALVNTFEDARPVTIAVLHGSVYGGATDLALACDFRLGVPGIEMFMPAARLGLHFYQRGLERYVSRLGLDQAKRLFLTAEKIDAEEMKAIGFLTHLVQTGELEALTDRLTQACAAMAPIAMLGMKRHLNRIGRGVLDVEDLNADIRRAGASQDLREGQAAWKEKRAPRFVGR